MNRRGFLGSLLGFVAGSAFDPETGAMGSGKEINLDSGGYYAQITHD